MAKFSNLLGTTEQSFKIGEADFDASSLSTGRTLVVPDKDGTLATFADITSGGEPRFNSIIYSTTPITDPGYIDLSINDIDVSKTVYPNAEGAPSFTQTTESLNYNACVCVSRDGSWMVVSDTQYDGSSGRISVRELVNGEYIHRQYLTAPTAGNPLGKSLDLNNDGSVLFASAYTATVSGLSGVGRVEVFRRTGSTFSHEATLNRQTAYVAAEGNYPTVRCSLDGSVVALHTPGTSNVGVIDIWSYGGSWAFDEQIVGTVTNSRLGYSMTLNGDGSKLLAGDVAVNSNRGVVRYYKRSAGVSTLIQSIELNNISASSDYFGDHIDIGPDGDRFVVSASNYRYTHPIGGVSYGAIAVFLYNNTNDLWGLYDKKIYPPPWNYAGEYFVSWDHWSDTIVVSNKYTNYSVLVFDGALNFKRKLITSQESLSIYYASNDRISGGGAIAIFTNSGTYSLDIFHTDETKAYFQKQEEMIPSGVIPYVYIGAPV